RRLARLQTCEHGVLGASTFHLFWDLFGMFARRSVKIYVDAGLYPIARWGVERTAARGIPTREFAHYDPEAFRNWLKRDGQTRLRPVLVTDGFCPDCGKPAPLSDYLETLRSAGGRLIVDDTQALGIFGYSASSDAPYGRGGGGMLPRLEIGGPDVLVISSLAKAFGAPVAVLSGGRSAVQGFEANSETRIHCSPPALPVIRAAERALSINRKYGDRLRLRLASLVKRFRHGAQSAGFRFTGGIFPVQTLAPASRADTRHLHERLLHRGVRTVLRRALDGHGARISFVITVRHTPEAIDRAIAALSESWAPGLMPQG
ncbi:MAG: aminotransferase class I/II-fold pyridoxal phosphate-dependent enzyme, partial [Terriglobales bacterium]